LKKRTFFPLPPLNLKIENVSLALHSPNVVRREPRHKANCSCKKFFVRLAA